MHIFRKYNQGKLITILATVSTLGLIVFNTYAPVLFAYNTHSVDLESTSSQYLSIVDANQTGLDLSGNLTLEMWVKIENAPATDSNYGLISKFDNSTNNSYILAYFNDAGTMKLRFHTSSDGSNNTAGYVTHDLGTNVWKHVAAVYTASSGNVEFFVDGSSVGTASGFHSSIYNGTAPFNIGRFYSSSSSYFDGLIDDVRVWNVARTAIEISDDRSRELNGNEIGLVGYWKLNNSLTDQTINGNDLSNNNSAVYTATTPFASFVEVLKVRKASNESVSNSTILQNDDSLKLSLTENKTYIVDGVLFASSTSATPDLVISFSGPSDVKLSIGYTNDLNEAVLESGATSTRISLPANTPTSIHLQGTVKTSSTSGDLQLKWAQASASAASTTVMEGSYLRAEGI